jgi:integrase
MDLALQTLQRREDVSVMEVPREGAPIRLVQQKTGKALEIPVSAEIQAVIDRALKLGVICPYIARMMPRRRAPQERKAEHRLHFAQLVPEQLTRGFAEARDSLDVFAQMPKSKRPSFHEIRGLGGKLYKELMGWTDAQVQALMGHEDVSMTRGYLDQHEPVYERVAAGLRLGDRA